VPMNPTASAIVADRCKSRSHRRAGFTMIEMLVTISIILLLIGISVVGLTQIGKHSKAQHTKVVLAAAQSMLGEFETSGGKQAMARLKSETEIAGTIGLDPVTGPFLNGATSWQQYSDLVLARLLAVPANRAIFDKLPSEQVQTVPSPIAGGAPLYELLDGYGHPIKFMPSAGLAKVTSSAQSGNFRLLSDGRLHPVTGTDPFPCPNPRPFFLSGGPDNDPLQIDDNQYSTTE
jgi:prepilin-type N-terminal cleavage/methylation domain-containing protein